MTVESRWFPPIESEKAGERRIEALANNPCYAAIGVLDLMQSQLALTEYIPSKTASAGATLFAEEG